MYGSLNTKEFRLILGNPWGFDIPAAGQLWCNQPPKTPNEKAYLRAATKVLDKIYNRSSRPTDWQVK